MNIGKYVLYGVIALFIAFALNFFNIVSIPWLDVPFSLEKKEEGGKKIHNAAQEALGEQKKKEDF